MADLSESLNNADEVLEGKLTTEIIQDKAVYWAVKRIFDIVASLAGIILLSPLFVIIALIIVLDDPNGGPIFYQERCGRGGKIFRFYKFRSMVVNAEDMLGDILHKNEMEGPAFKIKDDPRVTKVGRFIRRTSLDELPQLFNVLKGDMSIVGPRPALPREVQQYTEAQKRRLSITPGLTCYWQTSPKRNELTFDQWLALDMKYIDERCWSVDIKLILLTVKVMLTAQGE